MRLTESSALDQLQTDTPIITSALSQDSGSGQQCWKAQDSELQCSVQAPEILCVQVMNRAVLAGQLLAHVLMSGAHGGRPVTLIGFSMGARYDR